MRPGLLGNDIVAVGDDFVCSLEVAENLYRLVSPPLDDWMVLDDHDGADDSLLPGDSTARGGERVISHHQGRLPPGCSPSLALAAPRLAEQSPSEGLLSGEGDHHGLSTAGQTHCNYQAKTHRRPDIAAFLGEKKQRESKSSQSSQTKPTSWRSQA